MFDECPHCRWKEDHAPGCPGVPSGLEKLVRAFVDELQNMPKNTFVGSKKLRRLIAEMREAVRDA